MSAGSGSTSDRGIHLIVTVTKSGAVDQARRRGLGTNMTLESRHEGVSPEILEVSTTRDRHEYVIGLAGEFDLSGIAGVSEAFAAALASDAQSIVLDLRDVEFLDSTGVHAILTAARRASDEKKSFLIVRGPRQVQRIFEITGIADRLEFSDP